MGKFKEKFKKITTRDYKREEIINFLLYITIILVPLIITKHKYAFIEGKLIVLYIVGTLLFLFGFKEMFKPFTIEKKIVVIFLITILITCILSPYGMNAFIGSALRGEGFIVIAIYVLLFLVATKYFKISKMSLDIIFIFASIICIYGVFQFYGIDPIQQHLFGEIATDYGSISTIGNRNFLSNYICIFLFLSSGLYIFKKKKKYLYFAMIQFTGLLCTLTRGGWFAFLIFSLVGLFFIIKRKDCLKRAMVIFILFTIIFGLLNLTTNNAVLLRGSADEIVSEEGELVGSPNERAEILRVCWKAFKDRPIIGFGPDTLKTRLMQEYSDDTVNHMIQYKAAIDKAHNEYLEYAVSSGIFTLVSYLILIGLIIRGLLKGIVNDINKILLLTLVGYLIQAFVNISTIAVAPLYWIFLGFCVNTIYGKSENDTNIVI